MCSVSNILEISYVLLVQYCLIWPPIAFVLLYHRLLLLTSHFSFNRTVYKMLYFLIKLLAIRHSLCKTSQSQTLISLSPIPSSDLWVYSLRSLSLKNYLLVLANCLGRYSKNKAEKFTQDTVKGMQS